MSPSRNAVILISVYFLSATSASVFIRSSSDKPPELNCHFSAVKNFCKDAVTVHNILSSKPMPDSSHLYGIARQAKIGECPWGLPSISQKDFGLSDCREALHTEKTSSISNGKMNRDAARPRVRDGDIDSVRLVQKGYADENLEDGWISEHFLSCIKERKYNLVSKGRLVLSSRTSERRRRCRFYRTWKKHRRATRKLYKKSKILYHVAKKYCMENPTKCASFLKILLAKD